VKIRVEWQTIGGPLFVFKIERFEYFLTVFRILLKSFRCQSRNTWRPITK